MGEEAVGEYHQTYYLAPNTKWFRSSALIVHQFCFTSRRVGKRDVSRQSAPKVSIENDETLVGIEQTLQQTYFRGSARCVQSFDDSLDFAIRMTYRISLRSSSLWEPRHPLLKVVSHFARCAFCFKWWLGQQGTDDSIGNRSDRYHCNTPLYFYGWVY